MATELEELIQFLSSPSPQLRKAAIDIVQGLTGSEDGMQSLAKYPDVLLPSLARLLKEQKTGDDKMQGLYVMKIVRSFCRSASESRDDPFEHVASILVNISKKEAGRKLLLDPNRGLLKQIIRQYDSNSQLRKNGVFGTLRNCCFEAEDQLQNLLLIAEFLWPALLLPVAGNKVYKEEDTSKMPLELGTALSIEREQIDDPEIRVHALEAIYMIILQDAGRRAFWSINGPRILQVGYEDEENPKVMEAYERVGSLLVNSGGDEEPHD
ncbi:protein HGH1 homolog isoform X3 [Cucumis sativus]|uniref:protein HGH1 homolog isoform X3 n=1 Tax=Cucumis sativus TaxID=3659 RepID=UPI0012F4BE1C|nr:protein HGH1 homolog isoform X3 [Cucumis sativus]